MEVHTHSHTPRKKWTHYFWEFFMLFLAVSLGFLVENQREHLVESQRARHLAHSLEEDLRADTFTLGKIIRTREKRRDLIDSLRMLLLTPIGSVDTREFYRLSQVLFWHGEFKSASATVEQLKNSGYLRYYYKTAIPALITNYESAKELVASQETLEKATDNWLTDFIFRHFDADIQAIYFSGYVKKLMNMDLRSFKQIPGGALPIIGVTPENINEMKNFLTGYQGLNVSTILLLKATRERAVNFLAILEREY